MKEKLGYFLILKDGQKVMVHLLFQLKERDNVIAYIKNQKEHHKKVSFIDEYKSLLTEYEIAYDEKYLLIILAQITQTQAPRS